MIDLFFFRDLFSKKEKWFFAIFYILIGLFRLAGYALIAVLNLIILGIKILNLGSKS